MRRLPAWAWCVALFLVLAGGAAGTIAWLKKAKQDKADKAAAVLAAAESEALWQKTLAAAKERRQQEDREAAQRRTEEHQRIAAIRAQQRAKAEEARIADIKSRIDLLVTQERRIFDAAMKGLRSPRGIIDEPFEETSRRWIVSHAELFHPYDPIAAFRKAAETSKEFAELMRLQPGVTPSEVQVAKLEWGILNFDRGTAREVSNIAKTLDAQNASALTDLQKMLMRNHPLLFPRWLP